MRKIAVVLLPLLLLTGCAGSNPIVAPHPGTTDTLANSTYDIIAGAKGYLDSEKQQHPECPSAGTRVCIKITQAVGAKDLLADALTIYCGGANFAAGGACEPPAAGTPAAAQAAAKIQAAIANYNQIAADLKTATGGK